MTDLGWKLVVFVLIVGLCLMAYSNHLNVVSMEKWKGIALFYQALCGAANPPSPDQPQPEPSESSPRMRVLTHEGGSRPSVDELPVCVGR